MKIEKKLSFTKLILLTESYQLDTPWDSNSLMQIYYFSLLIITPCENKINQLFLGGF